MVGEQEFNDTIMNILGVDNYIMREYRDQKGYSIWLYIGYYESQSEGEMIHSPKHCMPGSGWNPVQTKEVSLPDPRNENSLIVINQMLLQKGLEKQLAFYWYQGRGRIVANEYWDRGYMVLDSILKRRSDGALIRITGSVNDLPADVEHQKEFITILLDNINLYLPL